MKNETKKSIIIIILTVIIIGLLVAIFSRGADFDATIKQIQGQRNSALRSSAIIELENKKIGKELAGVKDNYIQSRENNNKLREENQEYRNIIDELIIGNNELDKGLNEYGRINTDFAEFLRSAIVTE